MLAPERLAQDSTTVFCLHYLGGSSREWARVAGLLRADVRCVAIDLPGFGEAADVPGYAVAEMAAHVARTIRAESPDRWMIAGHSMGAKVAAAIARGCEDGTNGLAGLEGLVLIAGSPPGPEPMPDEQRRSMLAWFSGDAASDRSDAQQYIANNSNDDLDANVAEQAADDAVRMNRAAWLAWLERGSREDWAGRIGILRTPALVLAGSEDANLGPEAQRALVAPHFAHVRMEAIAGAKHLLPLERSADVARLILEHVRAAQTDRAAR